MIHLLQYYHLKCSKEYITHKNYSQSDNVFIDQIKIFLNNIERYKWYIYFNFDIKIFLHKNNIIRLLPNIRKISKTTLCVVLVFFFSFLLLFLVAHLNNSYFIFVYDLVFNNCCVYELSIQVYVLLIHLYLSSLHLWLTHPHTQTMEPKSISLRSVGLLDLPSFGTWMGYNWFGAMVKTRPSPSLNTIIISKAKNK